MDKSTVDKILDAQEQFYRDPEYGSLWEELRRKDREFQTLMENLSPQQRGIVDDYMGILHEMQRKLLCYAVERS